MVVGSSQIPHGTAATMTGPMTETSAGYPTSTVDQRLLMIYLNIPFCRSKCTFCDYVQPIPTADLLLRSHDTVRQRYISALCTEIRARGAELPSPRYVPYVLYWGGGTASILEADEIAAVTAALRDAFDLGTVVEATIECSPDTIDPQKLAIFRDAGFNRFSSGVQSMDDNRLRQFGRRHTADEARRAVRWARDAGFDNVNIDIMCGFPDEELDEVRFNLTEALRLPIDHISVYPFRPTTGTALRRQIDHDKKDLYLTMQKAAFTLAREIVEDSGLDEYASGYFGRASLFAVMYFQMRADIVGLGSGAMSMFGHHFRTHTKGRLHEYIANPTEYDVVLPAGADPVAMSNLRAGLSMFDGILSREWELATGVRLDEITRRPGVVPLIEYLRGQGLVVDETGMRLPRDQVARTLIELSFRTAAARGA